MSRQNPGPVAQKLRAELARYRSLRQHDATQPAFRERLFELQQWQAARLQLTHRDMLQDERYRVATEFFLQDVYGGVDLRELSQEVERAMNAALRVLPEKVMATSALALELNALSAELDERLTQMLFLEMGASRISVAAYAEAFRLSADAALREQQLALAEAVSKGLDKYVRSRVIYTTFKLVKHPARKAGIGNLHDFMGKGFAAMRPMGSASEFIERIVGTERNLFARIYAGDSNPFGFSEVVLDQ